MLVSIIVPVYNVKEYLIKCLDSINKQTLDDYEVIVVDDGSTDGCSQMIDDYCGNKEKFHVFHKENGGLMSAWMEGVAHATGDYLGFVDSDDYIDPTMFQKLIAIALQYHCDIVMCDRFDVKSGEISSGMACIAPGLYQGADMEKIYSSILPKFNGKHITNARWNKLFRRELFMRNIKYCEHRSRICEDRFITPSCVFAAKSFYYLDEPLYYYVLREGSNHSKSSVNLQDAMELLYMTQKRMLSDYGLTERYGDLVDKANLNYLRLMVMRNFSGSGDFKTRVYLAKRILNNPDYAYCIKKYKDDLVGKMGAALKILFKIKNPQLFVLVCEKAG